MEWKLDGYDGGQLPFRISTLVYLQEIAQEGMCTKFRRKCFEMDGVSGKSEVT
jgi:hypothetical protein